MSNIGWIKLHRKLQDCFLWDDAEPHNRRSAWIDLLLLVNHADKEMSFDGKRITVKAGQRITSVRKLSERWHWSKDRTERFLNLLVDEGMISKESDSRRTLLTVINYEFYQGGCDSNEDTHKDSDKDTHKDTDKPQTRIYKNEKNEKKDIYGEFRHVRLTASEKERLESELGSSMTEACIKKLDEYIEETGKKYKNHNLTIRRWVVDAVKKDKGVTKPKPNTFTDIQKTDYDFAELEKQLLSKPI